MCLTKWPLKKAFFGERADNNQHYLMAKIYLFSNEGGNRSSVNQET